MNIKKIINQCFDWSSFTRVLSPLTTKEKGEAFERIVQLYLQVDPKYKSILKSVWLFDDIPAEISKELNLPSQDKGIDLIGETYDGEYWAIQAKYREDESKKLTWKELSTFSGLAFGVCNHITFGLICTTAERVTKTLENLSNVGFCAADIWRELDSNFFPQVHLHLKGIEPQIELLSPRPHQKRAIERSIIHYDKENNNRGKLIWPCGTGKSLAAFWIAEALEAKSIIVVVPSLALMKQTLQVWLSQSLSKDKSFAWICVCSDETVGKIDRDDIVILTHDMGIPCVTDSAEIERWLESHESKDRVVFVTYQSGDKLCQAARNYRFDFGIFDEAHRTAGTKGKPFARLVFDENIDIRKRLFMTATERRYTGNKDDIISMDAIEHYGDTIDYMSFKEAIESDPPILSDYRVLFIFITQDEIKQLVFNKEYIQSDEGNFKDDIRADTLAALVALRKSFSNGLIKKGISFHSSIKRAIDFGEHNDVLSKLEDNGDSLEVFHVSGAMSTGKRSKILHEFEKADTSLITNARCLTEGVDIPNVDAILFADPKRSTVDIVQATGRALRLAPNKTMGYVIVPILISDNDDPDEVIDEASYSDVIRVLRALASNDERIIDYFRDINKGIKSVGPIEIVYPEILPTRIDIFEFVESINTRCWSKIAKLSYLPYEEAKKFIHKLNLNDTNEWNKYIKGELVNLPSLPKDIPKYPHKAYDKNGWNGMVDWLGNEWRPYEEAKEFVNKLNLKKNFEWGKYIKGELVYLPPLPSDIPKSPIKIYKDRGWINTRDWLGSEWRSYEEARLFVFDLGLKTQEKWYAYVKGETKGLKELPSDIPKTPDRVYEGDGWTSWGHWLRADDEIPIKRRYSKKKRRKKSDYLSFLDARKYARSLGLKSPAEWQKLNKKFLPRNVPTQPHRTYRNDGWTNYIDWLGCKRNRREKMVEVRGFVEARDFARKLGLSKSEEWLKYCKGELDSLPKLPPDIPVNPYHRYKSDGWIGMPDWLGYESMRKEWLSYADAKKFVLQLKLNSYNQWRKYINGEYKNLPPLPENLPRVPEVAYKRKGWVNWMHWLGTKNISYRGFKWRPFKEAREFVRTLGLKSEIEWKSYCKGELVGYPPKPDDIPTSPRMSYKNEFKSTGDWLGKK